MISLRRIAELVSGIVEGDADFEVEGIHSLENAGSKSISFYSDPKMKAQLSVTNTGALLVNGDNAGLFAGNKIIVENPYLAYAKVSRLFVDPLVMGGTGIHPSAVIFDDVILGDNVSVGAHSSIASDVNIDSNVILGEGVRIGKGVSIGAGCVIESNSVISANSRIGERCWISPGVVIGASGFGYVPGDGKWEKIEQLGGVVIGDDVDIGANTTIDRGALEDTVIGNGVKLDNQIQIAHNVKIDDNTIMAGCTAIAGSTKIGKRCRFGGRVSILGHLEIVDDVTVFANSFVASSIRSAGEYSSAIPIQPAKQWRKNAAVIRQLDKLLYKLRTLIKADAKCN